MSPGRHRDRMMRKRLIASIALAVLLHIAAWPVLYFVTLNGSQTARKPRLSRQYVTLMGPRTRIPANHVMSPNPMTRPPPKKKEEAKKEEEPPSQNKGQVVDLPLAADEAPEKARFLSESNHKVERETKSRHRTSDYKNAMHEVSTTRPNDQRADQPTPTKPSDRRVTAVDKANPKDTRKKSQPSQNRMELPDLRARDRLALRLDPELGTFRNQHESETMRGNGQRLQLGTGEPSEQEGSPGENKQDNSALQLIPELGVLARLAGAPANDHLDDMDEGEGTFLNTKEFKYASFFNRMKRGVSQHWHPMPEYMRRDPTGNIYGQRPRVTVLRVTLAADGQLQQVRVSRSSGLEFLDSEAVAAFRRAGPFPNPPRGLVDDTGHISFPFGFHLDFSRPSGLQLPF